MGVATRCGCKEVYRFSHATYPYSSCMSFLQQHPYFLVIKKNVSRSCIIIESVDSISRDVESGWNVWVWLVGVGGIYGCGYWVWL